MVCVFYVTAPLEILGTSKADSGVELLSASKWDQNLKGVENITAAPHDQSNGCHLDHLQGIHTPYRQQLMGQQMSGYQRHQRRTQEPS